MPQKFTINAGVKLILAASGVRIYMVRLDEGGNYLLQIKITCTPHKVRDADCEDFLETTIGFKIIELCSE